MRKKTVWGEDGTGAAIQQEPDWRTGKESGESTDHADRSAGETVARREPWPEERT